MCDPDGREHSEGCEYSGQPLSFGPSLDDVEISDYIRADNREHAKAIILRKYPQARFYR